MMKINKKSKQLKTPIKKPKVEIMLTSLAYEFYHTEIIKHICATMPTPEQLFAFPRFKRLQDRVQEHYADVCKGLSKFFFDYTLLACAGEARHATYYTRYCPVELVKPLAICSKEKKFLYGCNKTCGECIPNENGVPRGQCYKHALSLSKKELVKACAFLFEKVEWSDSAFGGLAWANAAKILQRFLKNKNKTIFIDSMFDVVHNGSSFFDKHEIFKLPSFNKAIRFEDDRSDLHEFLNYRKDNDVLEKPYGDYLGDGIHVSPELFQILSITHEWWLIPKTLDTFKVNPAIINILKYKSLKWGPGKINIQKVPKNEKLND